MVVETIYWIAGLALAFIGGAIGPFAKDSKFIGTLTEVLGVIAGVLTFMAKIGGLPFLVPFNAWAIIMVIVGLLLVAISGFCALFAVYGYRLAWPAMIILVIIGAAMTAPQSIIV